MPSSAQQAIVLGLLAICAALALGYWWTSSRPVILVDADVKRLACVSYAPFHRAGETPFDPQAYASPRRIEADLRRLARQFDCVRTYSVDQGQHVVPEIAARLGLQVYLGVWIGRDGAHNDREIARAIDVARRHPEAIRAIVVGNEVLLRGEQPVETLRGYLAHLRHALPGVPLTYADVWEFWLRHRELADAVDIVTIHILPYWEDRPVAIAHAVGHVLQIYGHVGQSLPGKEILIGETGWPSYGRQRQGAVPGRVNQARFIREFSVAAAHERIPYNVIEAFDQPWKRQLEGAVGGAWGLYTARGEPKFALRGPVSETTTWPWAAAALALAYAGLMFLRAGGRASVHTTSAFVAIALAAGGAQAAVWRDLVFANRTPLEWGVTGVIALVAGWLPFAFAEAIAAWSAGASRLLRPAPAAACVRWLRRGDPAFDAASLTLGAARFACLFGAAVACLLHVFDPRYRDFPIALYAVPAVGFALWSALARANTAEIEEWLLAAWLAVAAVWIGCQEHLVTPRDAPWMLARDVNLRALLWSGLCALLAGAVLVPGFVDLRARQGQCTEEKTHG